MAEQVSRQAAKVAVPTKLQNNESYAKSHKVVITTPAAVTWANGDTIASPVPIPVGSRLGLGSRARFSAFGASVLAAVGLRDVNGTAVAAAGVATAIDVSAAGGANLDNGTLIAAGIESVTTVVTYAYITFSGATPTANAQIHAEIEILTND